MWMASFDSVIFMLVIILVIYGYQYIVHFIFHYSKESRMVIGIWKQI